MPKTLVAASGLVALARAASDPANVAQTADYNAAPVWAVMTSWPTMRFDSVDSAGVYLMPREGFVAIRPLPPVARLIVGAEWFDLLPPSLWLTHEQAAVIAKQATSLLGDSSAEIDLGSAL